MEGLKLTPALLVALFERPHDRYFITQLETSLISFMDSEASSLQLKPMNSYYRLLAHQVAEYHGLRHTLSKKEICIVMFKDTFFVRNRNQPLLSELDPTSAYPCTDKTANYASGSRQKRTPAVAQEANSFDAVVCDAVTSPSTPEKPAIPDDDSPQPHQFETSRYKFGQQARKPHRRRSSRQSNMYVAPSPMFYSPQNPYTMPYYMYNPYACMYLPLNTPFSGMGPPPVMPFEKPINHAYPAVESNKFTENQTSDDGSLMITQQTAQREKMFLVNSQGKMGHAVALNTNKGQGGL
ncbi:LAMI_0E11430g1_1 [Lachancea mirantina]|uniref:LAMI_0E11430g1_1 n=1 Tax=Lachancea mirantina TaxID=1230905 RepID=A0A1G4JPJ4_9SACH|nr:LAMI_0E11430g1_1 [Lachancea mirantina]